MCQEKKEYGTMTAFIKAVFFCKENDFIIDGIYQTIRGTSKRIATRDLEFLTEIGLIEKVGKKKGTKYKLICA